VPISGLFFFIIKYKKFSWIVYLVCIITPFITFVLSKNPHLINTHGASALFILIIAIPAYIGLMRSIGYKRGILLIVSIYMFAMIIESIALITGIPYGTFTYNDQTVGFAWSPILIGSGYISTLITKNILFQTTLIIVFTLLLDFIMDHGAVAIGFWHYDEVSFIYGVPFSNFVGWIFSGSIGAVFWLLFTQKITVTKTSVLLLVSYLVNLYFWNWICIWHSLWISVCISILLLISLLVIDYEFSTESEHL